MSSRLAVNSLPGRRVALGPKRTAGEARLDQRNRSRVPIRVAGNLAENPIVTARVGEDNGRPQLCLRQIRKGKRHDRRNTLGDGSLRMKAGAERSCHEESAVQMALDLTEAPGHPNRD